MVTCCASGGTPSRTADTCVSAVVCGAQPCAGASNRGGTHGARCAGAPNSATLEGWVWALVRRLHGA